MIIIMFPVNLCCPYSFYKPVKMLFFKVLTENGKLVINNLKIQCRDYFVPQICFLQCFELLSLVEDIGSCLITQSCDVTILFPCLRGFEVKMKETCPNTKTYPKQIVSENQAFKKNLSSVPVILKRKFM